MLDQPQAVRPGEELNAAALQTYLADHLPGPATDVRTQQFPGGFSNLTYQVTYGGRDYVLRRPPRGANVQAGHDMAREYKVLSALVDAFPKVPRPVLFCADEAVLGAPFYLMERVTGVILRNQDAAQNPALTPAVMQHLSARLVDTLADIHAVDLDATGLRALGKPEGYARRQVEGWTRRDHASRTEDLPAMTRLGEWLAAHVPPERYVTFLHNDFKYDNLVLNPALTDVVAVLDWEMSTVGDPLMDLGTVLSYWIEDTDPAPMRMFGLTALPGNFTRQQVADHYAARSGRQADHLLFYFAFGMFKTAVIVQQIYSRYHRGLTQDARFGALIHVLRAYADTAVKALDLGRIDHLH